MAADNSSRPLIALTAGDYAGIGPELVLKVLNDPQVKDAARLLVVGDGDLLAARAKRVGIEFSATRVDEPARMRDSDFGAGWLEAAAMECDESVIGQIDSTAGYCSIQWIKQAASLALEGAVDAMVTAPINKQSMKRGGSRHEGHTELLGELTRGRPVMMLVGGGLRVAIVTRHVALRDVPKLLSRGEIVRTVKVVDESLRRDFGMELPRIAVLSLNPHASDGGRFGDEEKTLVQPAVRELQLSGIAAEGPEVPDVAFWNALHGSHDAVVAMYHDQGLIPLKTLAFDTGVNVTLGLPIVRTSPDHGTAFEIAGTGEANAASTVEAVRIAAEIAKNRRRAG